MSSDEGKPATADGTEDANKEKHVFAAPAPRPPGGVSLLGLEQAQSKASEMTGQAISALARFGSEADLLRELAIFITSRAR